MLVIHFVADFLLQSREMGTKKSTEFKWLLKHLAIIFVMFFVCLLIPLGPEYAFKFALYNMLIHGVIDWHIWKLYKLSAHFRIKRMLNSAMLPFYAKSGAAYDVAVKNWKYYEDHLFYSTIGFDQLLHALTIVFLLKGLFSMVML